MAILLPTKGMKRHSTQQPKRHETDRSRPDLLQRVSERLHQRNSKQSRHGLNLIIELWTRRHLLEQVSVEVVPCVVEICGGGRGVMVTW